ncbi:MAG: SAM-dependent methyltransferase [Actinomycetota bacterium]|nr:SAM-dependent methyltransferase [Actinomycetota bacterium]
MSGSLTVVGTGIGFARLTSEARAAIEAAEEVLYLVPEPVAAHGIELLNPSARSLEHCYVEGEHRRAAYARMLDEILAPVRAGRRVCAAFYGHPGVFVLPSHQAISRARSEGYPATMLPGISAEDCLFADLGIDPADAGCQSYEATRFLELRPAIERQAALVLWQIGVVGSANHAAAAEAPKLGALVDLLCELYSGEHEVVVYEASQYPGVAPLVLRVPLSGLRAAVTPVATLYVPPLGRS